VAAPELTSQKGRSWSQVTRGSIGAHLRMEVRSGAAGYMVASEPIFCREVWFEATAYVVARGCTLFSLS
jgi:hypothetical protein